MNYQHAVIQAVREAAKVDEDIGFLSRLRDCLTDPRFSLTQVVDTVDARTLGALYSVTVFVNDIWANLAIDTSFEFPLDHPRRVGFSKELRHFILAFTGEHKEAFAEAYVSFGQAVKEYCSLLRDIEYQLKKGRSK